MADGVLTVAKSTRDRRRMPGTTATTTAAAPWRPLTNADRERFLRDGRPPRQLGATNNTITHSKGLPKCRR